MKTVLGISLTQDIKTKQYEGFDSKKGIKAACFYPRVCKFAKTNIGRDAYCSSVKKKCLDKMF